jgi:hypothetical protein
MCSISEINQVKLTGFRNVCSIVPENGGTYIVTLFEIEIFDAAIP